MTTKSLVFQTLPHINHQSTLHTWRQSAAASNIQFTVFAKSHLNG